MTTHARIAPVAPWVGVAVVLLSALHDRFELVQNRLLIVVALAVAAAGIGLRWRDARATPASTSPEATSLHRRALIAFLVLGALSVGLAVAYVAVSPRAGLRDDLLAALVAPLLGWSVFLLLPVASHPAAAATEPRPRRYVLPLLASAVFVALWLSTLAREHWNSIDDVLYTFQAHRFALGDVRLRLDPAVQRFVKLPLMVVTPTALHAQYPPGYPAILAVFVRLGVLALSGATLGALAVVATYRLGTRLVSPAVGLLAAVLLATSPLFVDWSTQYMSHLAAMTAACTAAWLTVDVAGRSDRRRDVETVVAGFLLGVAVAVRPVTGLAIGMSIWLWLLARGVDFARLRRTTTMLVLGGALPVVALLAYNAATNGDPMLLGYRAALGHLNDLGFGERGIVLYDRDVQPVVSATQFTLAHALRNEMEFVLWPYARDLIPVWGLLPLVGVAFAYRVRFRWAVVAAFAMLPLVNLFYYGNAQRMHVELLPFVLVGVAIVVARVREVDARAARALIVFLVGANLVTSATQVAGARSRQMRRPSDSELLARALRDSARAAPGLLVFVRNPPLSEPLLVGLSRFNFGAFPGPVVVARDLGAENAQLVCRLPGYRVLAAESSTPAREAHLVSIADPSTANAPCDRPPLVSTLRPRG